MELMVDIDIKKLDPPVKYHDRIMLTGSCFTEHIGNALQELKFRVLQNPNGILFGPDSVCKSLLSYVENKQYSKKDLLQLNEVWHSWEHHSRFSNTNAEEAIRLINESQKAAHDFLMKADWLIITLGSSFTYRLTKDAKMGSGTFNDPVANCHRAPANWFSKELLEIDSIKLMLEGCLDRLKQFNPDLKFIFTVSPVRHIRDGVVENNRSKARLLEAVHYIVDRVEAAYYFPAYELVIDVLRDHRFYDIDLVHPNYAATQFVLEKFTEACIHDDTKQLMKEVRTIVLARKHRAFQPQTKAHEQFLAVNFEKAKALHEKFPFLDMEKELAYFSKNDQ